VTLADSLPDPDFAKAAPAMNCLTRDILREDSRLKRPDAMAFGFDDQVFKQLSAYSIATSCRSYVDTDFGHASIDAST
jgi:hypothetical protein